MLWISVKQASKICGRSEVTIRKWLRDRNLSDQNNSNSFFQFKKEKQKGRNNYLINEKSFINYCEQLGLTINDNQGSIKKSSLNETFLIDQIQEKDKQIADLGKQVEAITERLKESQYLLANAQQKIKQLEYQGANKKNQNKKKERLLSRILKAVLDQK